MAINRNKVLKAADKYTRQGKLEAAVQELLKLLKDNPKDMSTVNRVGDLYARLGKTREAVDQFTKIADHYNQEGFLLKSIAIYKKVTKLDATNAAAYEALARLYSQQGLTMEARQQFQVVAEHHTKEGNPEAALAAYREMLELDPSDLKIQLATAELLERLERVDEALEVYARVGADLDRRGLFKESRKVYEAALRLAPRNNRMVRRLVVALRRQEASGEALQYLKGLLEERPSDRELQSLVGDAHLDHGDIDQAREIYDQVRKQDPEDLGVRLNQVRLALHEDDPEAAFVHLEEALRAPGAQDHGETLIEYVSEVLDARPHHAGALRRLADLHQAAGQEAACRDAYIRLAGACMEAGKLEQAAGALERLIELDPENPRHQERLQDVLSRIRREGRSYPPAEGAPSPAVAVPAPSAPPRAEEGETPVIELPGEAEPAEEPAPAAAAEEPVPEAVEAAAAEPGVDVVGDMEEELPAVSEEVDPDFVAEHMTEAEVFVKYGLVDRALDQLRQVADRYPHHLPAREALLAIYRDEGSRAQAGEELRAIAEIHRRAGDPEKAAEAQSQAEEMGPVAAPAAEPPEPPPAAEPEPGPAEEAEPAVADAAEPEFEEEAAETEIDLEPVAGAEAPPAAALESVDALLEGGALEEARKRLLKLRAEHPERSEIEERLTRVGMLERQAKDVGGDAGKEDPDFFDLAAELDESLFEPQTAVEGEEEPEAEGHSLEDLVEAFKKGVEEEVSAEDFETHYNLAIAYKEMGLVDEAIGEFQFASKSPDFFLKCCSMLGLCFRDKGMTALAVKWYAKGLEAGEGDEQELLGLRYDLASLYEESGEPEKALDLFTEIYGTDAKYRDAADRMKALKEATAGG